MADKRPDELNGEPYPSWDCDGDDHRNERYDSWDCDADDGRGERCGSHDRDVTADLPNQHVEQSAPAPSKPLTQNDVTNGSKLPETPAKVPQPRFTPELLATLPRLPKEAIQIMLDRVVARRKRAEDGVPRAAALDTQITQLHEVLRRKAALMARGRRSDSKVHKTAVGFNVDRLRRECGWSFDVLADKTGLDKKLVLDHVNKGRRPYPRTLKKYANAFTKELRRTVTVLDLERSPE